MGKWVNSDLSEAENEQWQKQKNSSKICTFLKDFLLRNQQSQNYLISMDYFVKAGSYSDKRQHIICNAVLPNDCEVELDSVTASQRRMIQRRVIDLKSDKKPSSYFAMANECGVPLALFQQIVFGITDFLPRFLINQVVQWAKGQKLTNL